MTLPESVDIAGYTYTVSTDADELADAGQEAHAVLVGHCDRQAQTIVVEAEAHVQAQAGTLTHEILHALTEIVGLADEWDTEKEEAVVARLAPALALTIARNPQLCTMLAKAFA